MIRLIMMTTILITNTGINININIDITITINTYIYIYIYIYIFLPAFPGSCAPGRFPRDDVFARLICLSSRPTYCCLRLRVAVCSVICSFLLFSFCLSPRFSRTTGPHVSLREFWLSQGFSRTIGPHISIDCYHYSNYYSYS